MRIFLSRLSIAVTCLAGMVACSSAQAQEKDFESRQNISVSWDPTKSSSVNARYRFTAFDKSTRFKHSMASIGANYDVLKWLRFGGEYRYYTSYEQDYHRFQVYGRLSYKVNKKIDLFYRLQYQQRQDYFNHEYLAYNPPARLWRNRFLGKYQYSKKLDLYIYTESFTERDKGAFNTYRMRYGIGGDYLFKKRHGFSAELFVNDEFNIKNPADRLTVDLGYNFKLFKKKKSPDKKEDKQLSN